MRPHSRGLWPNGRRKQALPAAPASSERDHLPSFPSTPKSRSSHSQLASLPHSASRTGRKPQPDSVTPCLEPAMAP